MGSRLASHPSFCSEAKSRAALGYESAASSEEGGRAPWGGDAPTLEPTVRCAQAQRICHRRLPARRLAERVVSPHPKVLGRNTTKDIPALVVSLRRYRLAAQRRQGTTSRRSTSSPTASSKTV